MISMLSSACLHVRLDLRLDWCARFCALIRAIRNINECLVKPSGISTRDVLWTMSSRPVVKFIFSFVAYLPTRKAVLSCVVSSSFIRVPYRVEDPYSGVRIALYSSNRSTL